MFWNKSKKAKPDHKCCHHEIDSKIVLFPTGCAKIPWTARCPIGHDSLCGTLKVEIWECCWCKHRFLGFDYTSIVPVPDDLENQTRFVKAPNLWSYVQTFRENNQMEIHKYALEIMQKIAGKGNNP